MGTAKETLKSPEETEKVHDAQAKSQSSNLVGAVLLRPEDDDPHDLLVEGLCGERPPMVVPVRNRHPEHLGWAVASWAPGNSPRAIVLAWKGKRLWQGIEALVHCGALDALAGEWDVDVRWRVECDVVLLLRGPSIISRLLSQEAGTIILLDANNRGWTP